LSSSADADLRLNGLTAAELAARLDVPDVHLFASVSSTLDVANAIATSAPPGTVIVADEQTAGRGRQGRAWVSPAGSGLWLTLLERPEDPTALEVLSLRCGLYAA
jgi:BirA family transcriptional regulator, biotin operon repressor / biotin---[acetyl-CoA-carboxylase] ligase